MFMRLTRFFRPVSFLLVMLAVFAMPHSSPAAIIFSIGIAPPPLPVYDQPLCPGDGYIWTPGYWAYDDVNGYFWVPGTWVLAPEPGYLWTPGWWGWSGNAYVFNHGYWGPTVGFYGGINYGFGYVGVGYEGGYWRNGAFFYNREVNHVENVRNVYEKTVVINNRVNVSYNGGSGGLTARATAQEEAAAHERHIAPTSIQTEHVQRASTNHELFESANHGRPAIAATAKPGEFSGGGVVHAKSAGPSYREPTARSANAGGGAAPRGAEGASRSGGGPVHPNELPPIEHNTPAAGNSKAAQQYQQNVQKLQTRQQQERQHLAHHFIDHDLAGIGSSEELFRFSRRPNAGGIERQRCRSQNSHGHRAVQRQLCQAHHHGHAHQ